MASASRRATASSACYLFLVARDGRASTTASTTRRSFSFVLVAIHLVVFLFGGALLGERTARAASRHAIVTASTGAGDSPTIVTAEGARLDLAARARGERGERGSGPPVHFVLSSTTLEIAPAGISGTVDWRSASREPRALRSVVYLSRGPPKAR